MSNESHEWDLPITIRRRPSNRKLGQIKIEDISRLWDAMVDKAHELGFVIAGIPKPKATNCPSCGRLMLGTGRRCSMCGLNLDTGKVS